MANFPDFKGEASSASQTTEKRIATADLAGSYSKGDVIELVKLVSPTGVVTFQSAKNLTTDTVLTAIPVEANLSEVKGERFNLSKESLGVGTSAVGMMMIPPKANRATVQVNPTGSDIRYYTDNSNPTTTTGFAADAGDIITLDSREQITGFRAICFTGTAATLEVIYEQDITIDN